MNLRALLIDAIKSESLSWVLEKLAQAIESLAERMARGVRERKPTSELRKKIGRYRRTAEAIRNLAASLRREGD